MVLLGLLLRSLLEGELQLTLEVQCTLVDSLYQVMIQIDLRDEDWFRGLSL